jgi:ribosomal protein S18 acetylase RimI-like enzyme
MGARIRPLEGGERAWVRDVMLERWGDERVAGHGMVWHPADLEGFVAQDDDGTRVGILTYEVRDDTLEIVTMDAFRPREGIGTALMRAAIDMAQAAAASRVVVMTTNDNVPAIAFYEGLGFRVAEVREDAVREARSIKPSIPHVGVAGRPITDEVLLELNP